jgi:hypothetical protein
LNGALRVLSENEVALLLRGNRAVKVLQASLYTLTQRRPTMALLDTMQTALQDVDAALAITDRWLGDLRKAAE